MYQGAVAGDEEVVLESLQRLLDTLMAGRVGQGVLLFMLASVSVLPIIDRHNQ